MMRIKGRRIGCFLLTWVLLCANVFLMYADNADFKDNSAFLQGYASDENELKLFVAAMEDAMPSAEQFQIMLGDTPLDVKSVETAQDWPVAYYCLVDISGSVSSEQFEMEKAVLRTLCDNLSDGDSMVIAKMGNHITPSDYMTDKQVIANEIEQLQITHEDTNLYSGIIESIKELNSRNGMDAHKCLVVLSDGEDYQKTGSLKDEADKAIVDAGIPVFTVALMNRSQADNQTWIEYAKLLGSFARESAGGVHYNPVLDGTDGSSAGSAIIREMKNDLILGLDISNVVLDKDSWVLSASYNTVGGTTYGDTMTVYSRNLSVVQPTPEPTEEPESSVEPSKESEASKEPKPTASQKPSPDDDNLFIKIIKNPITWIVTGVVVVGIIVLVVVLVTRKKKAGLPQEFLPEDSIGLDMQPTKEERVEEVASPPVVHDVPPTQPSASIPFAAAQPVEKPGNVLFVAIGHENIKICLYIEEGRQMTIGRDNRADLILNPQDKKLSGVNSRIVYNGEFMRVWDAGSRNGTFVNGVPVPAKEGAILRHGQNLRVGSYEYRVLFKNGR